MLFVQRAKSYRRVFAGGEDSYALPLTSELAALYGENVNRFPQHFASESGLKSGRYMPKKKTDHEGRLSFLEVTAGFEPADNGVADRGLTTWLRHHVQFNAYILYQKDFCLSTPFRKII